MSVGPAYWSESLRVSVLGASGSGVASIMSFSSMFFMFPFKNISVSSFSPGDRKWASEAMAEAAAAATAVPEGEAVRKTAVYELDSLFSFMG